MVSLNCWDVLKDCLISLRSNQTDFNYEIIMVDNASTDATVENTRRLFLEVQIIENDRNVGFTKATNQAIRVASGAYLLWLNTDTILRPDSLSNLVKFMEANPQVGIVGPKVLNADGTFQPQCKRGMPTPEASFFYLTRLYKLFPQNQKIGQYLLTNLSPDHVHQVDAVSGCCLLARREVWAQIGPLDEAIFAFGEDIDWCVRARKAGWEVCYNPESVIVHLKGKGGVHSKPYRKAQGMHMGMWIFYRKHLMAQYAAPITLIVWVGIWLSFGFTCLGITLRRWLK